MAVSLDASAYQPVAEIRRFNQAVMSKRRRKAAGAH